VIAQWEGGLEVGLHPRPLEPGQRSTGIRVLDLAVAGGGWELLVEGERGRSYELQVHGARPLKATGVGATAVVEPTALFFEILRVTFPEGTGRATARVRLSP
jgi:hypothetical protein